MKQFMKRGQQKRVPKMRSDAPIWATALAITVIAAVALFASPDKNNDRRNAASEVRGAAQTETTGSGISERPTTKTTWRNEAGQ